MGRHEAVPNPGIRADSSPKSRAAHYAGIILDSSVFEYVIRHGDAPDQMLVFQNRRAVQDGLQARLGVAADAPHDLHFLAMAGILDHDIEQKAVKLRLRRASSGRASATRWQSKQASSKSPGLSAAGCSIHECDSDQ